MYKKYRYLNTDIHVYTQEENEYPRLLQADKLYPLSQFYSDEGKVKAIINCSYFTDKYVLGRNQGDLKNDTHDQEGFYDFVFLKDGSYRFDKCKSWDYKDNTVAGFSLATILVEFGNDVEKYSSAIVSKSKITNRDPQTALCVLENGKVVFVVADGRTAQNKGVTGLELRAFLKEQFDIEFLGQLDGGGSSQMMVDGSIVNKPSDGKERPMFNGLALIEEKKPLEIQFPCKEGWISQGYHSKHMAYDIGWLMSQSNNGLTPILACADGVVEVADYYEEVVSGKKVRPIVCIIRHDNLDPKYTYYSAYWHLSRTPKNTGDVVKMGDEIGTKGNTGYSGGVHLHFVLMKCPKGMKCPKSYDFNKYAVDMFKYFRRTENQVFDGKGQYSIPLFDKKDNTLEKEIETLKAELEQKNVYVIELEKEISILNNELADLQGEKEKLEQEYSNEVTTLKYALNEVNRIANKIVDITK